MEVFLWAKPEAARMKTEINRLLQTGKDCLFVLRLAFAFKLGMLFMQVLFTYLVEFINVIVIMQVVFNVLVPDHQGSMEDVEMKTHRHPQHNTLIEALLGGLDNWDAEYYIYIAQHGYTFLQSMAFFPLYPVMIWITSRTLLFPLSLLLADHSLFLLAGSLVNLCAFTLAAVVLYLLTWSVSGNQKFSHLTVVLFCVNPASVFMSAVYTETLFSLFTFAGLYLLTNCHCWAASLVFALASGTRSNGIVLAGFIAYYHLHNLMKTLRLVSLRSILVVCAVQCVVVVLPFLVFQWYSYHKFCHLPGSEGEEVYEWCTWTLPLSYSYIQQHYWNVGFLHYYKWKQIPNFLLALPVVWLSLSALYCHFCTSVGIMRKRWVCV